jgi:hypothetical protein
MLERLLRFIAQGGISTCDDLAERVSVSQPLIEAMLDDLVRLGYLQEVAVGCAGHCAGCSVAGCSVTGAGRVWALTENGARALRGTSAATDVGQPAT